MNCAVIFDMGNTLFQFARPSDGSWRASEIPSIRGAYRYFVAQGHAVTEYEDAFVEDIFNRLDEVEQMTGGPMNLSDIRWVKWGAAYRTLTPNDMTVLGAIIRYTQPTRDEPRVMPGAVDTLAMLRKQGYRIGLLSSTIWPGDMHLKDLEIFGLLPFIEYTLFSGETGLWKPLPNSFEHVLAALDVLPQYAVFVGDNLDEDIAGAQSVGMRGVLLRGTEFPLGAVQPDATIDTLPELLPLVAQWLP